MTTARTRTRFKDIKQSRSPLMRTTQWLSEGPTMKSILTMIVNKAYKGVGITDGLICHSSVLLDSQYQLQSNIDCAVKTLWNCFRVVPLASAMGTRSAIAPMCILVKVRNSFAWLSTCGGNLPTKNLCLATNTSFSCRTTVECSASNCSSFACSPV